MSDLRKRIESEFLSLMKSGDNPIKKGSLSSIKVRMVEWDKKNPRKQITDLDIIQLINSEVKKRDQAIVEVNGKDLSIETTKKYILHNEKENAEKSFLLEYLPKQMTEKEIIVEILALGGPGKKATFPEVMRHFNSNFKGTFNSNFVKSTFENLN